MLGKYNEYMNHHARICSNNVEDSESGSLFILLLRASQKPPRTWKRTLDEAQQKAMKIKAQIRISVDRCGNTIPQTFIRPNNKVSIHLSTPLTSFHTLNIASNMMVQMHYMDSLRKYKQLTWRRELESFKKAISLSVSHMIKSQDSIYTITG